MGINWYEHHLLTLYVQFTKNQAVKKWLSFELIHAVYLEIIVTYNVVQLYPILLTFYVQYTKNAADKQELQFECKCENILTSNFFWTIPNLTDLICSMHQEPICQKVASV